MDDKEKPESTNHELSEQPQPAADSGFSASVRAAADSGAEMAGEAPADSAHDSAVLPRYKCHKEVGAAKIVDIGPVGPDGAVLSLDGGITTKVDADFMQTKKPEIGGYLVEYEDGYRSFSPAEAFESGYTRIPPAGVVA